MAKGGTAGLGIALAGLGAGCDDETSGTGGMEGAIDITNAVFENRSGDCADYANAYEASVVDVKQGVGFEGSVTLTATATTCTIVSNNIPNHDFDDASAQFATPVQEVGQGFTIPRSPRSPPRRPRSRRMFTTVSC